MSEQILVQGKLLGIDAFLASPSTDEVLAARSLWVTLVCEVVPRALLEELELARLLLGSSGGSQFCWLFPIRTGLRRKSFLRQRVRRLRISRVLRCTLFGASQRTWEIGP